MLYEIDTDEKWERLINGLENGEILINSSNMTEEDFAEIDREIAKHIAARTREQRSVRQKAHA